MSDMDEFEAGMTRVEKVQLEGLVLLQIIKHCHESLPRSVAGSLLGLEADETLEVTNSFPSPAIHQAQAPSTSIMATSPTEKDKNIREYSIESNEYQMEMMKHLREVNMDYNKVGWYQSAMNRTYVTTATIENQFLYQQNLGPNAICIIYDPLETMKGYLSLKAFRLTDTFCKQYKSHEFTKEGFSKADIRSTTVLEEIPIHIHNSEMVQCYLFELQSKKWNHPAPVLQSGAVFDRLDLATNTYLENSLQNLNAWADELAQEHYKFQGYERALAKQRLQQQQWLQKRREENKIRREQGEELLSEEDCNAATMGGSGGNQKSLHEPSRLESLLITKQMNTYCENINRFAGRSFTKLFLAGHLHKE
jgi:translation initiation factor 3 subunit H